MKKIVLKVAGMTCSACSSSLEKYLNKQKGVNAANVNLVMESASIEYDENIVDINKLNEYIKKSGFESLGIYKFEDEEKTKSREKSKIVIMAILSIIILYISMAHMIKLPSLPFLDMDIFPKNYCISLFVLTTVMLIFGADILKSGIKNIAHISPNMDSLVTIGVISSYVYSIVSSVMIIKGNTFFSTHNLYFESAAIVIFFIKLGKYIEGKNKDKTKDAIRGLVSITPNHAVIIKDGKEESCSLDEISKGDILICRPGEKIAVDGTIIEGKTHIDESFITGESTPVKKIESSKVIAGSINYDGVIKYRAEKIGKDSTVSEIVRLVVDASSSKAPIAKIADKVSSYFVPIIICIAIVTALVITFVSGDINGALNTFVSVLVVACPCSLGLAVPLAIVVSSGVASQRGILIKKGEVLENASKVKTVIFDKTGTLTKGMLSIDKIYNYSDLKTDDIMEEVGSIENMSEHPISRAIVNYAKERKFKFSDLQEFEAISGYGIKAKIGRDEYLIGNRSLIEKNMIKLKSDEDEKGLTENGDSIIYVAKNKEVIALIGLKDKLKDEAKDVILKLKKRDINVVMLTGDNETTAKMIAKSCNIDKVVSNVKPKEKAQYIEELKKDGVTLMCGDGINDSVSLTVADVGVSFGMATDIAVNSSDVILVNSDLNKLEELITISKSTMKNIKQNLFWAFFYNILMVPIAMGVLKPTFGISISPMIASIAMMLSSLTVVFNALRLKSLK